jgi:(E)-4-hydroxy-3-methylbut-2-enyl-diphosphate synthase
VAALASMTNTARSAAGRRAGARRFTIVRVTVNNEEAAAAIPEIVQPGSTTRHRRAHRRRLPLQRPPAARPPPRCAEALAKYRINPGNVGSKRRDENFRTIVLRVALDDMASRCASG